MTRKTLIRTKIITFVLGIIILSSACSFSSFQEPTVTAIPPVTLVVTKIITQIAPPTSTPVINETPEILPSPSPSPTLFPTLQGTYDPYSAPLWYPIEDCPASRLHVGDRAFVTLGGGPNAIRFGADIHYDTIIGEAQEGEGMVIVDGPWCYYDWIIWAVKTDNGIEGFTPEGNGEEYWLLPEQKLQ